MFRPLFICMQKIFPETLQFSLNKGLQPFYLLTGNDLLLVNETKDAIIHTARLNGFDEKKEVEIKNDTNWEELFEAAQSMGLFFCTPNYGAEFSGFPHSDTV